MQEGQPRKPPEPSITDRRQQPLLTRPERPEGEVPSFGRLLMMAPLKPDDLPPRDRKLRDPEF